MNIQILSVSVGAAQALRSKNQIAVLEHITNQDLAHQHLLLDHIGWGFLNNSKGVKRSNYKERFFMKYPEASASYGKYKQQIDHIFEEVEKYFKHFE